MSANELDNHAASVSSSVINTVNTIIGSGMLVLPYAFKTDSIVLGTAIMLLAGTANSIGMIIESLSSKFMDQGAATFFTVCLLTYPKLSTIFDIGIFLQCFGVDVSYIVLTGDLMPLVLPINGFSDFQSRIFYILVSCIITVPLCFLHKLDSLRYASIVALIAIGYLALLIFAGFFYSWSEGFSNIPAENIGSVSLFKPEGLKPVFKTLGVIVLAYTCPNQYSIVSELANPTLHRLNKIVYISMSIVTTIFFSVAFLGYMTFGSAIRGNIILMYGDNIYVRLGRLLLVLMVLLSFPLMLYPARVSFNNIVYTIRRSLKHEKTTFVCAEEQSENTPLVNGDASVQQSTAQPVKKSEAIPMTDGDFIYITVILLITAYTIALSLDSFELILSVVGATGGVLISYILPGCYGYKLINTHDEKLLEMLHIHAGDDESNPLFHSRLLKAISLVLIVWGLLTMVICLWASFN